MDYSSPFYAHAELPDANTLYNPYAPHPSAQTQDVQTKPRKLKAPRVIRACDGCRLRKVRCDGGSPSRPCANCVAAGTTCAFETQTAKRGTGKPEYLELERRLETLEALLETLSAAAADGNDEDEIKATALIPVEPASMDHENVDRLAADLENMTVDGVRYVGRGSGLHLARSVQEYVAPGTIPFPGATDPTASLVETLLQEEHRNKCQTFELPPKDLADALIDAYFLKFNTIIALLHRSAFERGRVVLLDSDPSFRSLYFIILAIGARFVKDSRLVTPSHPGHPLGSSQTRGYDFFRAALLSASPTLQTATLFDLQAAVLSTVWLLGAASPICAWSAVGHALRRAIDVGAHRESRTRWNRSPLEDQLRKRAVYSLYGFDRLISASLGRPLAMQDEDFDLTFPLDLDDNALDLWDQRGPLADPPLPSEKPTPVSGLLYYVKLQHITGKALTLLYRTRNADSKATAASKTTTLDSLLSDWLKHMPSHLRWSPTSQDPQWIAQTALMYSSYYSLQILIHRDYISPARAHLVQFPSLDICSNAARSCSHVLDHLRRNGDLATGFWFAPLSTIMSGLMLLMNAFTSSQTVGSLTSSAMKDVQMSIDVLGLLGENTYVALKCAMGLSRLKGFLDADGVKPPPSHKRSNPDEIDDGGSPNSTMSSSIPSPASVAGTGEPPSLLRTTSRSYGVDGHAKHPRYSLPTTTEDLALPTYNGRRTFVVTEPPRNGYSTAPPPAPVTSYAAYAPIFTSPLDPYAPSSSLSPNEPPPSSIPSLYHPIKYDLSTQPLMSPNTLNNFLAATTSTDFSQSLSNEFLMNQSFGMSPSPAPLAPLYANGAGFPLDGTGMEGAPNGLDPTMDFGLPVEWESFGQLGFDFNAFTSTSGPEDRK